MNTSGGRLPLKFFATFLNTKHRHLLFCRQNEHKKEQTADAFAQCRNLWTEAAIYWQANKIGEIGTTYIYFNIQRMMPIL